MSRRAILPPKRRLQSAAREDGAIRGQMAQHDAFTVSGENHVMLAHYIAAANRRKADIATGSLAGDAVAAPVRDIVQVHTPPACGGFTQHQRSAGRGVNLVAMVGFDHLDIEILVQCRCNLLGQADKEVHPKAHVSRAHNCGVARTCVQRDDIRVTQPGGADDVDSAGLAVNFA